MLLSALWTLCFEMPFMTLDHAFLSHKNQSNLSSKQNQEKIFGSTDSSKEIYRSTEDSSSTMIQDSENFNQKSEIGSIYDQNLKDDDKDDKCPFIFVIGSEDKNSWSQIRNVHQNNGYNEDSDKTQLNSGMETRIDHNYESSVNQNLIRKKEFK